MPLTIEELTELRERRRIDFLERQLEQRQIQTSVAPEVPAVAISTATDLARGIIPQPKVERGLLEPVPVKKISDLSAIAQNIPKFLGRIALSQYQFAKPGVVGFSPYEEQLMVRQLLGDKPKVSEELSAFAGIPGLKEAYQRPLSILEKPENILQPLFLLLLGKRAVGAIQFTKSLKPIERMALTEKLYNVSEKYAQATTVAQKTLIDQEVVSVLSELKAEPIKYKPFANLFNRLEESVARYTTQPLAKGLWWGVQKFVGRIYNKSLGTLRYTDPELLDMLRKTTGEKSELVEQINRGALALQKAKELVAQKLDVEQMAKQGLTPEQIAQKVQQITELRVGQLTEQPTVPFGKLAGGEIPKAGITSNIEIAQNIQLYQAVQTSLTKQLLKLKNADGTPVLDPETAWHTIGAYMHRIYQLESPTTKRGIFPFRKHKLNLTELKERGKSAVEFEETKWQTVIDQAQKESDKIDKQITRQIGSQATEQAKTDALQNFLKRQPELQKQIREAQAMKDWASERVDIPYEIRQKELNQINDPTTRFVIGGLKTASDITNWRLFEKIATDPKRVTDFPHKNWIKLPETKTWGQLAGKYVEPTTYREVFDLVSQSEQWNKSYQAILSLIKKNLTVRSPATQIANYTYNIVGAYFADVSTLEYSSAVLDNLRGIKNPIHLNWFKELQKLGRTEETWTTAELSPILERFYGVLDTKQPLGVQIPRIIDHFTEETIGKIPFFSSKYYQAMDIGIKWAIYKKGRSQGLTPEQAIKPVDLFTQDYRNLPPVVKSLRKTGIVLFPSFFAENIRILKNAAIHKPIRFATIMSAPFALTEIMQRGQSITDDEMKATKQALPWWSKIGWHVWLPIRNEDGTITLNDASYLLGFTSVANFTDVRSLAQNPLFTVSAEGISGKDLRTGKDIVKPEQKSDPINVFRIWSDRMLRSVQGASYRIPSEALKMLQGEPDITGHTETYEEFIVRMLSPVKEYPIRRAEKGVVGAIGSLDLQLVILKKEIKDLKNRFPTIQADYKRGRLTLLERDQHIQSIKDQIGERRKQIDLILQTKRKQEQPVK